MYKLCICIFFFLGESHKLYVYDGSEGKLEMAKHILYKKNYSSFFIMYNGNFCEISLYLFLVLPIWDVYIHLRKLKFDQNPR